MRQRDTDLSRRSTLRGATVFSAASTLPLSAGVTAADPRREGPKPDMNEVDPERFDYGDAIREYERIETRTGAEIRVDIIRPDADGEVPTLPWPP